MIECHSIATLTHRDSDFQRHDGNCWGFKKILAALCSAINDLKR